MFCMVRGYCILWIKSICDEVGEHLVHQKRSRNCSHQACYTKRDKIVIHHTLFLIPKSQDKIGNCYSGCNQICPVNQYVSKLFVPIKNKKCFFVLRTNFFPGQKIIFADINTARFRKKIWAYCWIFAGFHKMGFCKLQQMLSYQSGWLYAPFAMISINPFSRSPYNALSFC